MFTFLFEIISNNEPQEQPNHFPHHHHYNVENTIKSRFFSSLTYTDFNKKMTYFFIHHSISIHHKNISTHRVTTHVT